jgi:hypothetical protein
MKRLPLLAMIGTVLVAGLLAGCTPTTGTTAPTTPRTSPVEPSTPSTVAPEPSTTPSDPAASTKPTLAELVVGPEGIGPVKIGSPIAAEPKSTAVVYYKPDFCLLNGKVGEPNVGQWLANYPKQKLRYGGPGPFDVYTNRGDKTGSVLSIRLWSSTIATATGVRVGDTEAQVKAAYPHPTFVLPGNNTRMYVIDKAPGRMIIEVATTKSYWEPREIGTVLWILVQPVTLKARSIAGTDSGCGT